jgi:IclR family pca regulon transcriptional regulator
MPNVEAVHTYLALVVLLVTFGRKERPAAPSGKDADPKESLWDFERSRTPPGGDRWMSFPVETLREGPLPLRYSPAMAEAPETERSADGERQQSLQSLERGMAVIQVFSRERPALTLSEVANLTGITRATARRILLTLEKLGHVRSDGRLFSSLNLSELALPLMEALVEETHESCSAATLDLPDVVYVARVPTRRIMSITLSVGTRLPAHCTSMGRVLLAALPPDQLDPYLADAELERWTDRTITDPDRLRASLDEVRQRGWALVDQELEIGLRSVAAPIRRGPETIAALNVSSAVSRVSLDDLRRRILPPLVQTADTISNALTHQGPAHHRPVS